MTLSALSVHKRSCHFLNKIKDESLVHNILCIYVKSVNTYHFTDDLEAEYGVCICLTVYFMSKIDLNLSIFKRKIKFIVNVVNLFHYSLFGCIFAMPRYIYSMASDGLLYAWLGWVSKKSKTPIIACLVCGTLSGKVLSQLGNLFTSSNKQTSLTSCYLKRKINTNSHVATRNPKNVE